MNSDIEYKKLTEDKRSPSHNNSSYSNNKCRVYVGNLAWKVQWQELKDHMRKLGGQVMYADVLMDREGRSKGCGIVEYVNENDAQCAIEELTNTELLGRKIFVREDREDYSQNRRRNPRQENFKFNGNRSNDRYSQNKSYTNQRRNNSNIRNESHNLYDADSKQMVFVSNLPLHITWRELKDVFKGCGTPVYAQVYKDENDTFGCGTVRFSNKSEATDAIMKYNGLKLGGNCISVRFYGIDS